MNTLRSAFLTLLVLVSPASAQSPEQDALAVVRRLFDAMRAQDTVAMRTTLDSRARLVATGTNQQGQPTARTLTIDGWVRSIGSARARLDERIFDPEIRVDQNLATVWTRYDFLAGDNFSHCGYDAFQLIQTGGQWKIVQIADTQRRSPDSCGRASAPTAPAPPTATDTAAIVTALQRVFDGMRTRDTASIRQAFIPDGVLIGLQTDAVFPTPIGSWLQSLARIPDGNEIREQMVHPEVRISDNLATIWTWYDLHMGDRFSHCGIDAAQLVRTVDGWKVAQISYTTRRSPCESPARKSSSSLPLFPSSGRP
ncbi:MAG: nuclear transport factor 2 family protein [Longimicrobiales bacterium]